MKLVYVGVMGGDNGFTRALRNNFESVTDCTAQQLASVESADMVFLQPQAEGVPLDQLRRLKDIGAFIVNWTGDVRQPLPKCYADYGGVVHLTCFSNLNDVDIFRIRGFKAEFLQIGYDPAIYHPDHNVKKDIDIVFMGNTFGHFPLSGLRRDMVRELKRAYGDRFRAFGSGMPDGNLMGNQPGEAAMYRRAKIGINLSHFNYRRYTSDRMFRMLGCGVCVLSHRYPGCEQDFDGNQVVFWDDMAALKGQINQFLGDEITRNRVAFNGHRLALDQHTFNSMTLRIKDLYERRMQYA